MNAISGAAGSMYIGNDMFGTLTLKDSGCGNFVDISNGTVGAMGGACVQWSTGASLMGFGVNVATDLANAQGNAILGLTGDLAGMFVAAEVNASTSAMDATVGTSVIQPLFLWL